jgi:replicative DNA helicase
LVQLGANALRQKKNVLHYTFELSEAKVGNRYDSNLCGVSATDILDEGEYVKKSLAELRPNLGRLIIKEYPTNSATVMTLRAHIEKLAITKSFRPDIILVDYADIMRSSRQFDAIRHEQKLIYEELRGLCMELHIPIWTASQSNRDSTDADVVGLDKIAESFGKAQVCDFIISLARKPVQKSKGQANLFVAKSRLGRDGLLFATHIDTSMSMFEIIGDELDLEELQNARRDSMNKLVLEKWNEVANERMAFEKKAMHAVKE